MADSEFVHVYVADDAQWAHLLKAYLADEGIEARVIGDSLQSAAGELPPGWVIAPEVWVPQQEADRARELIGNWEASRRKSAAHGTNSGALPEGPSWECASCGATVPDSFEMCWQCETPRPVT